MQNAAKIGTSKNNKITRQAGHVKQNGLSENSHGRSLNQSPGNQGMWALLAANTIQAKLKIGQPNDKYEQEADRVADTIMRMPEPIHTQPPYIGAKAKINKIQRNCTSCSNEFQEAEEENRAVRPASLCPECRIQTQPVVEKITPIVQRQELEEDEDVLQAKSAGVPRTFVTPEVTKRIRALQGKGQPLSRSVRNYFEPRFGCDFSGIRVHVDREATEMAKAVNAKAFTYRNNIFFGNGQYIPNIFSGRLLLAHELTHSIQQGMVDGRANYSHARSNIEIEAKTNTSIVSKAPLDVAGIKSDIDKNPQYFFPTFLPPLIPKRGFSLPIVPPHTFTSSTFPVVPPLHAKGPRSGDIGFAAAGNKLLPSNKRVPDPKVRPDPDPVPTDKKLPIKAYFFPAPSATDKRALILGGVHGDEKPGYELAEALVAKLKSGKLPKYTVLAFHLMIVPRVNPGGIYDYLNKTGFKGYDHRCNRQIVDLNRNLPTGGSASSKRCPNTNRWTKPGSKSATWAGARLGAFTGWTIGGIAGAVFGATVGALIGRNTPVLTPIQPETKAIVDLIKLYKPHRILTMHAISSSSKAGIYADANTDPGAQRLACGMSALIVDRRMKKGNLIIRRPLPKGFPKDLKCNPLYPGDKPGKLGSGRSLGAYAPTRSIAGQSIPVITLEVPKYKTLKRGKRSRSIKSFLRPIWGFVTDPAKLESRVDNDIVRDIESYSDVRLRLFLTGRIKRLDDINRRIKERVTAKKNELNALSPKPPNKVTIVSHQRAFSMYLPNATPQAKILFDKLFMTGKKSGGWDTLPSKYYTGRGIKRKVNRNKWLNEPPATRLDVILKYSAIPGASRHHWITDVDFNSTTNKHWGATTGYKGGPGKFYRLGLWLRRNAPRVGFRQVYTAGRLTGAKKRHEMEPWHYSYAPISIALLRLYSKKVRQDKDVVDPIMKEFAKMARRKKIKLPKDLRPALSKIPLSNYVKNIGPGL